jgi:hypothetical protein
VTRPANYKSGPLTLQNSNYVSALSGQQMPAVRSEVANVIRALRAMPPGAREGQIESGRYSNLSPEEMSIVRAAVNLPPA